MDPQDYTPPRSELVQIIEAQDKQIARLCKAEAKLARAAWLMRQLLGSLPARRDWLDPEIEKEAKALASEK